MTQTYPFLAFVYFNGVKPPLQFRFSEGTHLAELISILNSILQYPENRKVVKLEYRSPSSDPEGKVQFTQFVLKTIDDLKVMWRAFRQYSTKDPIEVDAKIQRSGEDVIKMLQHTQLLVYNNM
ncbi:uncharacterized protein LOC131645829 [Vicia villosa]|uniref:uncharacterized protein LOC131645829 n=1 Tax=Vicia villosa TaxID=3911 RepID=UPI00273AAEA0|nr:uncharacterized protein LOC131645829 [Vicia villosa]